MSYVTRDESGRVSLASLSLSLLLRAAGSDAGLSSRSANLTAADAEAAVKASTCYFCTPLHLPRGRPGVLIEDPGCTSRLAQRGPLPPVCVCVSFLLLFLFPFSLAGVYFGL